MIEIMKESESELIKKAQKILNYQLGRGEEYTTVDDIEVLDKTKSGKTKVRVSYKVHVRIPVGVDPDTGVEEYESDYEYRTADLVI